MEFLEIARYLLALVLVLALIAAAGLAARKWGVPGVTKAVADNSGPRVGYVRGDARRLPFADGSFDAVCCYAALYLVPEPFTVLSELLRVLAPGGRLAVSDIALKTELPEALANSLAAYVGCIAGAIKVEEYRNELLKAGFEYVEIVDSGRDLNAYAKVENQSGCCSPAMESNSPFEIAQSSCCAPATPSVHDDLGKLLSEYDVNEAAASVKVYALKPEAKSCCGPACCA